MRTLLEPEFEVVGTTADGCELVELAESRRPDLVIADVSMPVMDGLEATRRLQAVAPEVRVLILSIHDELPYVQAAFAAGAWGYLTKTSTSDELQRAVREVLADRFYVSPALARATVGPRIEGAAELPFALEPLAAGETLTPRELDTLHLLAKGLGNQEIARRLGVAVTTVRTHLRSLYEKLRLESRVELALYAAQARGTAM